MTSRTSALAADLGRLRPDANGFGLQQAVLAVSVMPLALVTATGVVALRPGIGSAMAEALFLSLTVLLSLWLSSAIAGRNGGYNRAFGLRTIDRREGWLVIRWSLIVLVAQGITGFAVSAAVSLMDNGSTVLESPGDTVLFVLGALLVAPVLEEVLFRGVMLRGLLLHGFRFWPSALLSSLAFALSHIIWIDLQALALTAPNACFGLLQCVLVRRTGSLGPAILVHGLTNVVGLVLLLGAL